MRHRGGALRGSGWPRHQVWAREDDVSNLAQLQAQAKKCEELWVFQRHSRSRCEQNLDVEGMQVSAMATADQPR